MNVFERLINFLIPSNCMICGKRTDGGELCNECSGEFIRESFLKCESCGKPAAKCECGADFTAHTRTKIGGRGFIALTFYKSKATQAAERTTERMIYALKNKGTFAEYFSTLLAGEIRSAFSKDGTDLSEWTVTYPPRSQGKFNRMGFDQSEEIARRLAKKLGVSFSETFTRTDEGEEQKNLRARERYLNAEESRVPIKKNIIKGGKYIIFDDIITSGATVETMAKHLYFAGADSVFPVTVARTFRPSTYE